MFWQYGIPDYFLRKLFQVLILSDVDSQTWHFDSIFVPSLGEKLIAYGFEQYLRLAYLDTATLIHRTFG